MLFSLNAHHISCVRKQQERRSMIDSLPSIYSSPLSISDEAIHSLSLSQLVTQCKSGKIAPSQIMLVYAKKTLVAHASTNCATDIMFDEALRIPAVVNWPHDVDLEPSLGVGSSQDRPLMGVPVSIKDSLDIAGHDTTIGYSRNVDRPAVKSSAIVRLLKDSGALVHAKTTAPTGLIGLETTSDVFGCTTNPHKKTHTVGGSSGGGAALLACGGSKIEIGSDLGGSVRIPAHFCGIWSLKGSSGRFPTWGSLSPMVGLEGVSLVSSPMAGNLPDLGEFWKRVVDAKPWMYDHTCIPMPWKPVNFREEGRKLKWGVMINDGLFPPSPACRRALGMVISALREQGHEVAEFCPPNVFEGSKIGYQLIFADGGEQLRNSLVQPETLSKAAMPTLHLLGLPRIFKRIMAFFLRRSDPVSADLYSVMHPKSVVEVRDLVGQREQYRAAWHEKWIESGLDFVLTVPYPFPAFEHGASEKTTLMSAGYTLIFNMLDYTAGVLPVTFVDKDIDGLPPDFYSSKAYNDMNALAKGAYSVYDAEAMHGLPLGVQVVGKRLEEEKVLEGMNVIEEALKKQGMVFAGKMRA
ncbi:amidase signature domain-containing protein [Collybia nuda]|uniref:Amidase signature domain-containing protein n=1 Tax=Collybia nuda TaxID=64659 RepID=A0A9P5XV30_9AGAR|nr:amidase signature domain-containing protein [Collybia nuda]